jgi:hypothetical protein
VSSNELLNLACRVDDQWAGGGEDHVEERLAESRLWQDARAVVRQEQAAQTVLLQNRLKHFRLNLWVRGLALDTPVLAAGDVLHLAEVLDDLVPDLDPLVGGEEAEQAHGGSQHYAVAQQRSQPRVDAVELEAYLLPILLDILEDVLRAHVRDLRNLNLRAEQATSLLHPLEFLLEGLQLPLLFLDEILRVAYAEGVRVDARLELGNLGVLL